MRAAANATGLARVPGVLRRLASLGYETLLVLALLAVALLLPHILIAHFLHLLATPVVLWAHLFLVLLLYFAGLWIRQGDTPAMRAWGIRLENREGRAPRPAQALLRYLLCWPSFGLFGVGICWAWFDADRQFLHDRLAGTRIVFR